jgi:hypothetical protein
MSASVPHMQGAVMRTAHGISIKHTTPVLSSAAAISAISLLITPVCAHAVPPVPLEPGCMQYEFVGRYELGQHNLYNVAFNAQGQTVDSRAWAQGPGSDQGDNLYGNVSGGIQGRKIDFTIHWDEGPIGHYTGDINDDGTVHNGWTEDETNPGTPASWTSGTRLGCASSIVVMPIVPLQ